jgi:hypothetical protein
LRTVLRLLAWLSAAVVVIAVSLLLLMFAGWLEYSSEEYYHGRAKVQAAWAFYTRFWAACAVAGAVGTLGAVMGWWAARRAA